MIWRWFIDLKRFSRKLYFKVAMAIAFGAAIIATLSSLVFPLIPPNCRTYYTWKITRLMYELFQTHHISGYLCWLSAGEPTDASGKYYLGSTFCSTSILHPNLSSLNLSTSHLRFILGSESFFPCKHGTPRPLECYAKRQSSTVSCVPAKLPPEGFP